MKNYFYTFLQLVFSTALCLFSTQSQAQDYLKITSATDLTLIGKEIYIDGLASWYGCLPYGQTFTAQVTDPYVAGPAPLAPLNGNVGVCVRGTYWYIDKAKNIQDAGGVGMIQIADDRPVQNILIGENVLNFHYSDDCYYEEWFDEVEDGWIALVNFHPHVMREFEQINIDSYFVCGGELDDLEWSIYSPFQLFKKVSGYVEKRLNP